ncbi:MAG: hypothetical protein QOC65_747 [Sphingomonadales bacterium]|nr:hypothetical protein [Sphingomonadales bacterium]
MLAITILPALALAAATETPAIASAVIECTARHAAALASSEQSAAAIAEATVLACSHTLDRLNEVSSQDPETAVRERNTKTALRDGFLTRMREMAIATVERERSRP